MRSLSREHLIEAAVGLAVVLIAAWFIAFAWQRTGGGTRDGIAVKALFPSINGVSVGTDVRVAGMKVGSVTGERLDPDSYQAELTMIIDRSVSLPSDSSAAVASDGLLGGSHIQLTPGGSETPLKAGDTILDTQGAVDMMSLIGSVINRPSDDGGAAAGDAAGDAAMAGEGAPAQ